MSLFQRGASLFVVAILMVIGGCASGVERTRDTGSRRGSAHALRSTTTVGGDAQCRRLSSARRIAATCNRGRGSDLAPRPRTVIRPFEAMEAVASVLEQMFPPQLPILGATGSKLGVGAPAPNIVPPVVRYPLPISDRRCGGEIGALIERVFGAAGPWAESVVWRESNCRPDVRNGSSGSAGLFQLYRHDDLLAAVCPNDDPAASWAIPECNVAAAYSLYLGSGISPWSL